MRRRERGLDLACIIDPADCDLAALAVIAHQGDAALLAVAGCDLLGGEPVVGLVVRVRHRSHARLKGRSDRPWAGSG